MRGWHAFVAKAKTVDGQVLAYAPLNRFLDNYRAINVLPFENVAAIEYRKLQARKIRIGTMDLKIAAIALAPDALLITRNTSDFEKIAGLRLADWTR